MAHEGKSQSEIEYIWELLETYEMIDALRIFPKTIHQIIEAILRDELNPARVLNIMFALESPYSDFKDLYCLIAKEILRNGGNALKLEQVKNLAADIDCSDRLSEAINSPYLHQYDEEIGHDQHGRAIKVAKVEFLHPHALSYFAAQHLKAIQVNNDSLLDYARQRLWWRALILFIGFLEPNARSNYVFSLVKSEQDTTSLLGVWAALTYEDVKSGTYSDMSDLKREVRAKFQEVLRLSGQIESSQFKSAIKDLGRIWVSRHLRDLVCDYLAGSTPASRQWAVELASLLPTEFLYAILGDDSNKNGIRAGAAQALSMDTPIEIIIKIAARLKDVSSTAALWGTYAIYLACQNSSESITAKVEIDLQRFFGDQLPNAPTDFRDHVGVRSCLPFIELYTVGDSKTQEILHYILLREIGAKAIASIALVLRTRRNGARPRLRHLLNDISQVSEDLSVVKQISDLLVEV